MGKARMSAVSNAVSEVPPPAPASHEQNEDRDPWDSDMEWPYEDPEATRRGHRRLVIKLRRLQRSTRRTSMKREKITQVENELEELKACVGHHHEATAQHGTFTPLLEHKSTEGTPRHPAYDPANPSTSYRLWIER